MAKFVVEITVEVEADNADYAWEKANDLVSNFNGAVNVSEPEEVEE